MVAPKLRFRDFSAPWGQELLANLVRYTKGFAFKSDDYRSAGVRIIRVSDLSARAIKHNGEMIFIDEKYVDNYEQYKIKKEEIIITTVGSKPELVDSAVGRGIFVTDRSPGLLNQNMLKLNSTTDVSNKFLFCQINTERYITHIKNIQRGNANQSNITVKELLSFPVFITSFEEQTKITNFLSSVDERITLLNKQYDLLCQYKKGMMQKIFSQELRFKDKNREDFPEWEYGKISDLFSNKSKKHNPLNEISYPCIELDCISQGDGQLLNTVDSSQQQSIKNKFKKGDVLFGKLRPYLRKYILATFDGVCSSEIWVLKGILMKNSYLYQFIQTDFFINLANKSTGSKMPRADWDTISSTFVFYPYLEEQTKIANFLSAIDDKIAAKKSELDKLKIWKQGLLQQMFV